MDKQSLERLLADGLSLERIGKRFGKDPSTVAYWMRKHGLRAAGREKHAAKGGLERGLLEQLVEGGLTIAEIAEEVGRSKGTVRYWLRRHGMRTQNARGRRRAGGLPAGQPDGPRTTMICARHGETEFLLEPRGYYRCRQCRSEAVTARRRRVEAILVAEAGGCCRICGYDRCSAALQFHHVDPVKKRLEVNANGAALALDTLRAEASKCVLLCSNCHAEVENGVTLLPATVPRAPG
jgi:transposase-like protein